MASFASNLRNIREAKGVFIEDLATDVRRGLPRWMSVSRETLRRMENGHIAEDQANPIIVATVARVLGVDVADISPAIAAELEQLADIITIEGRAPRPVGPTGRRRRARSDSLADHPISSRKVGSRDVTSDLQVQQSPWTPVSAA